VGGAGLEPATPSLSNEDTRYGQRSCLAGLEPNRAVLL